MQVFRNIYQVSGSPYGVHPNVYIVKGHNAVVMIDTGLDESELTVVLENMKFWGLSEYPVTHVLITHSHFDHSGNAHIWSKRGSKIAAGPSDAEGIELGDDRTIGYAYAKKFTACPVDIKVKDGDTVETAGLKFDVIHVPGHSSGCVFYRLISDDKVILFTGDVIRVGTNCEFAKLGWSGGIDYDQKVYFESLKKVKDLECDIILAGHFQPCLKDGFKILQNAYMKALLDWRQPATYD